MSLLDPAHDPDDLFDNSDSGFAIEEETEELINEVFNRRYEPVYNPASTIAREQEYQRRKKQENKQHRHKLKHLDRKQPPKIYKDFAQEELTPSFQEFLTRAQERWEKHSRWVAKEREKEDQCQAMQLKDVPHILRGSREKMQPIYERCIDLQRERERKLEMKRIQKSRAEAEALKKIPFKPSVNGPHKVRHFEEYLAEKETWQREKSEQLERKRLEREVQKLSECTFTPQLVSTYNRPNSRIVPGERVEERLLRSLERQGSR